VVSEVAVNEVVLGPVDGLFQYVTVIEGDGKKKQPHKYSAALVTHVRSGDREYDVVYDSAKKGHALIDVTARDKDVGERLKGQQKRLWTDQSDEDREKKIAEYKKHLEEIQASYSFPTTVHETKFFLFLTDLPASQVPQLRRAPRQHVRQAVRHVFGSPNEERVSGEVPHPGLHDEESFLAYETKFLNNPGAKGNHGLCHYGGDGR